MKRITVSNLIQLNEYNADSNGYINPDFLGSSLNLSKESQYRAQYRFINKNGFSLVEVLVSIAILSIVSVCIYSMLVISCQTNTKSEEKLTTVFYLREVIEDIKNEDFLNAIQNNMRVIKKGDIRIETHIKPHFSSDESVLKIILKNNYNQSGFKAAFLHSNGQFIIKSIDSNLSINANLKNDKIIINTNGTKDSINSSANKIDINAIAYNKNYQIVVNVNSIKSISGVVYDSKNARDRLTINGLNHVRVSDWTCTKHELVNIETKAYKGSMLIEELKTIARLEY